MARNLLSPLPTPRDSIAGRRSGCPLRSLPPVTVRAGIPLLIVIRRYSVTAPLSPSRPARTSKPCRLPKQASGLTWAESVC
jgi:hypothetical protein